MTRPSGSAAPSDPPPNIPFTPAPSETAGLPAWLFPAGFWVAVALLAVTLLFPALAQWAVAWVMVVPVLAALWVAVSAWRRDRRLSVAAVIAVAGLGVVFLVKGLLK
ncbi:hypothetical protein MF271_07760 [Deinococcus sp. KNUC1210]|uniref:hypothetical protein n=1 Tax=Deinococcus sp. KNUC1210 TaxID=2917691 RepID=UPI001EF0086D|nr:hypothetical protein [Deinococcus sp. KNUC1210]ULH16465.1 hypothetical protein MF271_07760 [Deinococcus sp. KNUC1210]